MNYIKIFKNFLNKKKYYKFNFKNNNLIQINLKNFKNYFFKNFKTLKPASKFQKKKI